jgi:hypothetical protein
MEDQGLGAQLGAQAGKGLSALAKSGWKYLTGMGDYTIKSNSLFNSGGVVGDGPIQIMPSGDRETRIRYKEYLGDVFTHPTVAGQFFSRQYSVNPGLLQTFPWFASIAQQYETWEPRGIVFEFRSTSTDYAAVPNLGSVIMATDYDVVDVPFANKQEMLNAAYSNEGKPSSPQIIHGLECDPRDNANRIFYVRSSGTIPTGTSLRDYDLGLFEIATQGGSTANANLGSLYVHYDIVLRKEQIFNGLPMRGMLMAKFAYVGSAFNNTNFFSGLTPTVDNIGLTIDTAANTIRFPFWINMGEIVFIYAADGASTAVGPPTVVTTNSAGNNFWGTGAHNLSNSNTGTRMLYEGAFAVTGPGPTVAFTSGTGALPTSPTQSFLIVMMTGNYGA